jgi:hypothetical protein
MVDAPAGPITVITHLLYHHSQLGEAWPSEQESGPARRRHRARYPLVRDLAHDHPAAGDRGRRTVELPGAGGGGFLPVRAGVSPAEDEPQPAHRCSRRRDLRERRRPVGQRYGAPPGELQCRPRLFDTGHGCLLQYVYVRRHRALAASESASNAGGLLARQLATYQLVRLVGSRLHSRRSSKRRQRLFGVLVSIPPRTHFYSTVPRFGAFLVETALGGASFLGCAAGR